MGHDAADAQPVGGSQMQSSLSAVVVSQQLLQGLDSLVQRRLLGHVHLKPGLVVGHRTVGAGPLTAKAEEQK